MTGMSTTTITRSVLWFLAETLANITALWCARNACFPSDASFDGVEQAGLAAALRREDAAVR